MPFRLSLRDNHSHMVGSCDELDADIGCPVCSTCGYRTDPFFTNPRFVLKQKRYDISSCYDGAIIVSDLFVRLCVNLKCANLVFTELPKAKGFFHLKCLNPIVLDYDRMGTRRERLCRECRIFRDFVEVDRIYFAEGENLDANDLRLSDRWYGSNNEALHLILVGDDFASAAKAHGIKGVDTYRRFDA